MTGIRNFSFFQAELDKRASRIKQAGADSVPEVPEKDPQSQGTVAIPVDPNANTKLQNLPPLTSNAEVTPVLAPPAAKKIVGEETPKDASTTLTSKAAKMADAIRGLVVKKADANTQPNMPANNAVNKGTAGGKQPPVTPQPAHGTADANAKTSGAENMDTAMPKDKDQKTAPEPPQDVKGGMPKDPKNTNDTSKATETKMASEDVEMPNSIEFLAKLATVILSTEEGRTLAQAQLERAHGAETAASLIKAAAVMEQQVNELAQAEDEGIAAAVEMFKSASEADKAVVVRTYEAHQANMEKLATEWEKQAYAEGAQDAAGMADMLGGGGGEMPAGPEGAPPGAEMGAEPPLPDPAQGQVPIEIIQQAIVEMVQSGELPPEAAEQVLQILMGGGGEGGAPGGDPMAAGGAPPMDPAAGGMPPADPAAGGAPPMEPPAEAGAEKPADKKEPKEEKKEDKGSDKEAGTLAGQLKAAALAVDELLAGK